MCVSGGKNWVVVGRVLSVRPHRSSLGGASGSLWEAVQVRRGNRSVQRCQHWQQKSPTKSWLVMLPICVCVLAHSKWKWSGGWASAERRRERRGRQDVSSPLLLWPLWPPAVRVSARTHTHTGNKMRQQNCIESVMFYWKWDTAWGNADFLFLSNSFPLFIHFCYITAVNQEMKTCLYFHIPLLHTVTALSLFLFNWVPARNYPDNHIFLSSAQLRGTPESWIFNLSFAESF